MEIGSKLGKLDVKENAAADQLDAVFKEAARRGVEFILCIVPEKKEQSLKGEVKWKSSLH